MACLCEVIGSACKQHKKSSLNENFNEEINVNEVISASEFVAAKAEIWLLQRSVADAKKSLQELEVMRSEIGEKNAEQMNEIREIQLKNAELRDELHRIRDAHTVEKNAMLRQLHELRLCVNSRSQICEKLSKKNKRLTIELRDAHEKIYMVGMKFLKLKAAVSINSSKSPSSTLSSSDEVDSSD